MIFSSLVNKYRLISAVLIFHLGKRFSFRIRGSISHQNIAYILQVNVRFCFDLQLGRKSSI
jgi:hypothetical protein